MRHRTFAALIISFLLASVLLIGTTSSPREVEAQPTGIELGALCVHFSTGAVSAPINPATATCPSGHFILPIPDAFPFILAIHPFTQAVIYTPTPLPGYINIQLPDAGIVPFCMSLYTRQLSYSPTNSCPFGSIPVLLVGEIAPEASDDGPFSVLINTTLDSTVTPADDNLLSNDDLGLPAGTIASFGGGSLPGDASTTPAGNSIGLAGGTVQVNANGSFILTNPTTPGDYTFDYRLSNVAGSDDATVMIQVQQAPDAVDDLLLTPAGVSLAGELLSNDLLGFPPAMLANFGGGDLGGSVTDHEPGDTPTLAGGTLQIDAGGSLNLTNPTQTGSFTFDYRLANAAGSDEATVTIQIDDLPTVVATTPLDTATTVAANVSPTITFSEPVTVTGDWFEIACASSGTYNPTGSGGATTVTVVDTDPIFTLDTSTSFTSGELCTVTVVATQVSDDDAIDPPDAMGSDFSFSFTIDSPPTVTSTSPVDGATEVPVDSNITVTFSEAVGVAAGWFNISCGLSGVHTAAVSGGPTSFTLNPDVDFALSESCTVTLMAAQIADQDAGDPPDLLDGNGDGAGGDDYVFSFTTPDAPPHVTLTTPPNLATSVDPAANLMVSFDEGVTVSGDWFVLDCGGTIFNPTGSGGATVVSVTDTDPTFTPQPSR